MAPQLLPCWKEQSAVIAVEFHLDVKRFDVISEVLHVIGKLGVTLLEYSLVWGLFLLLYSIGPT